MNDNKNFNPISIDKYLKELDDMVAVLSKSSSVAKNHKNSDISIRAHRAEWHVRGLIYHCRNIIKYYGDFCTDVIIRATADPENTPSLLIMCSPSVQFLMYEFYALVNLAKISLDNLSKLVYPLFDTIHLPKSISDYDSGTTNCPMYERLANDTITHYLIDLRNCLVHYRSFATNDNAYVYDESVDYSEAQKIAKDWIAPMAKALFRITEDEKIVVNIFLPDNIFERNESGDKKLTNFTYENRKNLLSYSMRFARTVVFSTIEAFAYYKDITKRFIYNKHGLEKQCYEGSVRR